MARQLSQVERENQFEEGERFVAKHADVRYVAEAHYLEGATKPVFTVTSPRDYKGPMFVGPESTGRLAGNAGAKKNGKTFISLHALMMAIIHPSKSAPANFAFWTAEADVPAKEAEAKAKAKVKAETAKSTGSGARRKLNVITRNDPQPEGLEAGQVQYRCVACQESFIAGEELPETCPKGHRADGKDLEADYNADATAGATNKEDGATHKELVGATP